MYWLLGEYRIRTGDLLYAIKAIFQQKIEAFRLIVKI